MNPYQYGANNPIKFIDVNGDSIRIGDYTYIPGQSYEGDDSFTQAVVSGLNYLLEKDADETGVINFLAGDPENDLQIIKNTRENNPAYRLAEGKSFFIPTPEKGGLSTTDPTVVWDPSLMLSGDAEPKNNPTWNFFFGKKVKRSPIEVLLHELGHAKNYFSNSTQYYSDKNTPDNNFSSVEERKVINTVENPAARALRPEYYRPRKSHSGRWVPAKSLNEVKYRYK